MKKRRRESGLTENNLNTILDTYSQIIEKMNKTRTTLNTFKTMLGQVQVICYNKSITKLTMENDVSQWFQQIQHAEQLRIQAIQRLKTQNSEQEVMRAAVELNQIIESNRDVEKSRRRWARLIKAENYTNESLKDLVLAWINRWIEKWNQLDQTLKSLLNELQAVSERFLKMYKDRHKRDAVLDNADSVLNSAEDLINTDLDTPIYNASQSNCSSGTCVGNCNCNAIRPPNNDNAVVKPNRRRVSRLSGIKRKTAGGGAVSPPVKPQQQQEQQQQQMPQITPEMFQQFMLMQQQQQQQQQQPVKPPKPKSKKPKYNMMAPQAAVSYGADEWT